MWEKEGGGGSRVLYISSTDLGGGRTTQTFLISVNSTISRGSVVLRQR